MIDVRAILLDWGGTLVHAHRQQSTRIRCAHACVDYLHRMAVPISEAQAGDLTTRFCAQVDDHRAPDDITEFDSRTWIAQWAADHAIGLPETFDWTACINATWQAWRGCLDLIGDVPATLLRLRDAGLVLGLVSNCATPAHIARDELARLGILKHVSMTLFSSELGWRKPHPRVYRTAVERLQRTVPAIRTDQICYVGDTPHADVDGPALCGMRTALVGTGNWSGDPGDLATAPDIICASIHDLPNRLGNPHRRAPHTATGTTGAF